jgi:hypothetical protein
LALILTRNTPGRICESRPLAQGLPMQQFRDGAIAVQILDFRQEPYGAGSSSTAFLARQCQRSSASFSFALAVRSQIAGSRMAGPAEGGKRKIRIPTPMHPAAHVSPATRAHADPQSVDSHDQSAPECGVAFGAVPQIVPPTCRYCATPGGTKVFRNILRLDLSTVDNAG